MLTAYAHNYLTLLQVNMKLIMLMDVFLGIVMKTYYALASTCGNSTACVCYLNWKPVDPPPPPPPPPPQQTDGPVGKEL